MLHVTEEPGSKQPGLGLIEFLFGLFGILFSLLRPVGSGYCSIYLILKLIITIFFVQNVIWEREMSLTYNMDTKGSLTRDNP